MGAYKSLQTWQHHKGKEGSTAVGTMLAVLPLLLHAGSSGVTIHNHSDCCCENLPDRSAKNLVASVEECVASCKAAPACHAAVLLDENVKGQCHVAGSPPAGMKCCLHKGHFDTMHAVSSGTTVIDMGTSSGPCPHPAPPPPTPVPSSLPGRPLYHFTRESGEMNDPNGLLWQRLPGGTVEYHMFHQHADPSCKGFDDTGSHAWGKHTTTASGWPRGWLSGGFWSWLNLSIVDPRCASGGPGVSSVPGSSKSSQRGAGRHGAAADCWLGDGCTVRTRPGCYTCLSV